MIVGGECGPRERLMFGNVSDAAVRRGMMTSREGSGASKRRKLQPEMFEVAREDVTGFRITFSLYVTYFRDI